MKKNRYLLNIKEKINPLICSLNSLDKNKIFKNAYKYFFIFFLCVNISSLFYFNSLMLIFDVINFGVLYSFSFVLDKNITSEIVENNSLDDSIFFTNNKKFLLISSAGVLLLYFNFFLADSLSLIILSFLFFILIVYYLIQNSNIINHNKPILKINKYGITSSDYSYYLNFKKTNNKKTRYIFIPWQSMKNIDFLKRGGKKLIIKSEYAFWSYVSCIDNTYVNNPKGQWHIVPENIDIIINISMMNSIKFFKIEKMLEKYRSINMSVKPNFELVYEKEKFKAISETKKVEKAI